MIASVSFDFRVLLWEVPRPLPIPLPRPRLPSSTPKSVCMHTPSSTSATYFCSYPRRLMAMLAHRITPVAAATTAATPVAATAAIAAAVTTAATTPVATTAGRIQTALKHTWRSRCRSRSTLSTLTRAPSSYAQPTQTTPPRCSSASRHIRVLPLV